MMFHHVLFQEIGCISLWYTVRSHCLPILNVIVVSINPKPPAHPTPLSPLATTSLFSISVSLSLFFQVFFPECLQNVLLTQFY